MTEKNVAHDASDSNMGDSKRLGQSDRTLKLKGHVGFDRLPNQLVNMVFSTGFNFNILIIGESGVGKTSLIKTLLEKDILTRSSSNIFDFDKNVSLNCNSFELNEAGIKMKIKIVESDGFGDQLNRSSSANYFFQYIVEQMKSYAVEELKSDRTISQIRDNRVHVCLFLISPVGCGLKTYEIETMKKICKVVNLIPIITKVDSLTSDELAQFKKKVMNEIVQNEICLYSPPIDDPASSEKNKTIISKYPLGIINANDTVVSELGKRTRVRKLAWNTVNVEDDRYSDFNALKDLIIKVNMYDLMITTSEEIYRCYKPTLISEYDLEVSKIGATVTSTNQRSKMLNKCYDDQLAILKEEYNQIKEQLVTTYEAEIQNYIKISEDLKRKLRDLAYCQKENTSVF